MLASIYNLASRTFGYRKKKTHRFRHAVLRVIARRRTEKALNRSCPDLDLCLALDKHAFESWFKFDTFQYATAVTRLKSESRNGSVFLVTYARPSINHTISTAYAILKHGVELKDDLRFEYLVGQFLNKHRTKLPVFVGTYGIFSTHMKAWYFDGDTLRRGLRAASPEKQDPVLLLQYAPGEASLFDFLMESPSENDFFAIMYHIYFSLARLANVFTHYDLHHENVRIIQLSEKPFRFIYPDVSFSSKYLPKIIDYGKCFYYDTDQNNSANWIVSNKANRYLSPKEPTRNAMFRNMSGDLRLLALCDRFYTTKSRIRTFLDRVVYTGDFCTPELTGVVKGGPIRNVLEAELALRDYVRLGAYDNEIGISATRRIDI